VVFVLLCLSYSVPLSPQRLVAGPLQLLTSLSETWV
jgi:hypothetical protein